MNANNCRCNMRWIVLLVLTQFTVHAAPVPKSLEPKHPVLAKRPLKKLPNVIPATGWVYRIDRDGKQVTWKNDESTLTKFFELEGYPEYNSRYCDDPDCERCFELVYDNK